MKRKICIVPIVLIMVVSLMACATTFNQKPLTAKQQGVVWFSIYNSTYDDTMNVMKNPAATPAQKEIAQKKKVILTQVWPLLQIYASVVDSGATPDADITKSITDLMNHLTALTTGGQ